jgi:hypothetical protein
MTTAWLATESNQFTSTSMRTIGRMSAVLLVLAWIHPCIPAVSALQQQQQQQQRNQQQSTSSSRQSPPTPPLFLNVPEVQQAIYSGHVYQQLNFLSETQVQTLLAEIEQLEANGSFQHKGLSNTAATKNTFSKVYDRSICPVPWFGKAIALNNNHQDDDDRRDNDDIPQLLRLMQGTLSEILNRPTLADTTLDHECYYSKSEIGSQLARHMDERHEELKGAKGWLRPSRRSLSWLIYLSDPADWTLATHGGALRSFPQAQAKMADSTHNGNLQVGWLQPETATAAAASGDKIAVYLDSWSPVMSVAPRGEAAVPEPHCVLYTVEPTSVTTTTTTTSTTTSLIEGEGDDTSTTKKPKLHYLTRPWLNDSLQGMNAADFIHQCAKLDATAIPPIQKLILFTDPLMARRFTLLEDRAAWDANQDPQGSIIVDTPPLRGSLVIFDSVTVPHQVELIKNGTRVALAGWFHEATQPFPEEFYALV